MANLDLDLNAGFDYIVVGGGTAGLVVASRLSENPRIQVLVVEAGADHLDDPLVHTPGYVPFMYGNAKYDWNINTTPQVGLLDRQTRLARGKGLGGSSIMNFMSAVHPSRSSLDTWAALGNQGWAYDDLAPYYRKSTTRHPPSDETREITRIGPLDEALTGNGPIHMSYGAGFGPLNSSFMDALAEHGLKATEDPLSGHVTGAFQNLNTIDPETKTRSHSATAYYDRDVRQRSNLVVLTETVVEKIELDGNDPDVVATGIQFRSNGGPPWSVKARREVILACGAVHSPQMLELSGIGGKTLLHKLGIRVYIDNRGVGENLQDHPMVCHSYQARPGIAVADMFRDPAVVKEAVRQYEMDRGGPLGQATTSAAYLPMVDVGGRMSPEAKKALLDEYAGDGNGSLRDLLMQPDQPATMYVCFASQMNILQEAAHFGSYLAPLQPDNYISIVNALNHPFSRGSCHIQSRDVAVDPVVDPNYVSHPADLEILARSAMFAETVVSTEPFKSNVLDRSGKRMPETVPDDLDKAKEVTKTRIISFMHLCGTCAMLPRDQGGVVSDKLIVHGTKNVRVVDASIFPLVPLGNIQTTVYAVAEKASDMIKADQV